MNIYLEERAQDEICKQLIKKFAGIYYPYKPVDIIGFAKFLGLKLVFVTFCDDLKRLGFYSDGKTQVTVMSKNGPISKVFPNNTILISDYLRAEERINKLRFTVGHETGHHIKTLMTGKAAEEAYLTELDHDNECSYCQHNMGVGIAVLLVVDSNVGAHSRIYKLILYILPHKRNALLPCQFMGQGNFNLPCKLRIFRFLDFLNCIPQNSAVCIRGGSWSGNKISVWTTPPLRV